MYFVKNEADYIKSVSYINSFLNENYKLNKISKESMDFLIEIFKVNPKQRLNWNDLFKHPLIWKNVDLEDNYIPDENIKNNKFVDDMNNHI